MATAASKGYKGLGMNGVIATWYAKNTQKNIAAYRRSAQQVAQMVPEGGTILELAPGPGYLAIELAKLGNYHIAGLDISATFVEIARAKAKEAGVDIDFRLGNAAHMPLADDLFDFIVCSAAFKNFAEPLKALDEMYRVLKPGGKALLIDLRPDASIEVIEKHIKEDLALTGINFLLTKWAFEHMLLKRAYTKDEIRQFASRSKFKTCTIDDDAIGMNICFEKLGIPDIINTNEPEKAGNVIDESGNISRSNH
jgi:ubiquinone/menaquinone biosynthesis C-methylase UbiE